MQEIHGMSALSTFKLKHDKKESYARCKVNMNFYETGFGKV